MPERLDIGTAIVHLGGVRFPVSGPLRYTMTGSEAVELCRMLDTTTVIPVHYKGWKHFPEGREAAEQAFAEGGLQPTWLKPGQFATIEV